MSSASSEDLDLPLTRSAWQDRLAALPGSPTNIPAFFFGHGSPVLTLPNDDVEPRFQFHDANALIQHRRPSEPPGRLSARFWARPARQVPAQGHTRLQRPLGNRGRATRYAANSNSLNLVFAHADLQDE
jgi:hypothetical protein